MSIEPLKPGTRILWFEGTDDTDNIAVDVVSDDGETLMLRDEHGRVFDGSHGNYMPPVRTIGLVRFSDLFGA